MYSTWSRRRPPFREVAAAAIFRTSGGADMQRSLATILLTASIALPLPAAAQAQAGYTLAQVESIYPRMKAVHIQKCDRNGDNLYTKSEMLCVQGIYQAMYIDR
jgi:hypothetical protein